MSDNDREIFVGLANKMAGDLIQIMNRYLRQVDNSDLSQAEWMIDWLPTLAITVLGNTFCYMDIYNKVNFKTPKNESEMIGDFVNLGKSIVEKAIKCRSLKHNPDRLSKDNNA